MRRLTVFAVVALLGVSLAQAQGQGTRGGNRRGGQGRAAVQPRQNTSAPDDVQRPIQQRLRDPSRCQATDSRPARQRLRDPASCPRFNAAGRDNRPGSGWGCLRGGGRGGCSQACCPCCGRGFRQGNGQRGWRR